MYRVIITANSIAISIDMAIDITIANDNDDDDDIAQRHCHQNEHFKRFFIDYQLT